MKQEHNQISLANSLELQKHHHWFQEKQFWATLYNGNSSSKV